MFQEKAGALAGKIWEALNANGELSGKDLKKAIKVRADKDLELGLGGFLRDDTIVVTEEGKDITVVLK